MLEPPASSGGRWRPQIMLFFLLFPDFLFLSPLRAPKAARSLNIYYTMVHHGHTLYASSTLLDSQNSVFCIYIYNSWLLLDLSSGDINRSTSPNTQIDESLHHVASLGMRVCTVCLGYFLLLLDTLLGKTDGRLSERLFLRSMVLP